MGQGLFSSSRGPKSSHGVGPRLFWSCSKELGSKGEEEWSLWGWLLVPRDHSKESQWPQTEGHTAHPCLPCPHGFQTVLWKTNRDPILSVWPIQPPPGASWRLPQLRLCDEAGCQESIPTAEGREKVWSDFCPRFNCVCVCVHPGGSLMYVCVCPSRGSLTPKSFETLWYNSCKPDCLGLNFQLYHLLAVWPWAIYTTFLWLIFRGLITEPTS